MEGGDCFFELTLCFKRQYKKNAEIHFAEVCVCVCVFPLVLFALVQMCVTFFCGLSPRCKKTPRSLGISNTSSDGLEWENDESPHTNLRHACLRISDENGKKNN